MSTLVQYISVQADPPSLQDNTADLDRLKKVVLKQINSSDLTISLAHVPTVSKKFRQANFSGVAVVNQSEGRFEIVDFFSKRPKHLVAMALDLGTTHLEASLVDLLTGEKLALANQENAQIRFGDDILSRIHYAGRGSGLEELHKAAIESINALVTKLAHQADIDPEDIRAMSVSGNPTMVHLFLKIDPHHLCREPYIPVVNAPDSFHAQELSLAINPAAPVIVLPSVGSYFGGDLISGILASGLDQQSETCMLIDVGTNAEVVLGNKEWLIACAGAAGPALEGGVAKMGMRAGPGAIEHLSIDSISGEITYQTIEDAPACGICGSGIIDLVAALYLAQIIDLRGKFREGSDPQRLKQGEDGLCYTVVPAAEAAAGKAIVLSQVDLDAMMRSKAAMYSILSTLVKQVGLDFSQLKEIFVAGAFGRHIDPHQAITLGMLPDLPIETYHPVGNSSLAGAEMVLLEEDHRRRCSHIMQTITYLELNVNQEFMMRFSGSKFIPHTDRDLFPSVPVFEYP